MDAQSASALFAASSDVSLVVDRNGVVQDIALGNEDFYPLDLETWVGSPLEEVVAVDSQSKAVSLLQEARADTRTRWREVNLRIPSGASIPLNFTAVRLSDDGDVVLFGRDLATVARLQQRVIDIQREMEADYARLRNAESRYRLLFQLAREPVLVVDASNGRIIEANPAAAKFLGTNPTRLIDKPLKDLFAHTSGGDLGNALTAARTLGRPQDVTLRLADRADQVQLSASQYRQDFSQYLLVRFGTDADRNPSPAARQGTFSIEVLKKFPDAFVVTDPNGCVLDANTAFMDLVQLPSVEAARGESLDQWLGRPGVDFGLILSNLRDHGSIREFATLLRGELGASEDVDVTAVAVPDAETPCIGIVIRPVRRRGTLPMVRDAGLNSTVENLTHLVGTMPLKDLVRETTDMIEQMCIEAALKLTDDNRASAAQILGLSRQSLYAKLHRFGLKDMPPGLD
ncbi:transcriptional regulator PpsR [Mongoliimonas terrestris]|uniref:transcriptional regulator PpsR n=1 Tax=Mongoliimonas terrestris TaxID=1709001 RepID=UPI001587FAF4|nr:transcriptional regulator PpsR [Mongoliimonas terrestris]